MTDKQSKAIELASSKNYTLEEIRDLVGYSSISCVRQALRNGGVPKMPFTEGKIKRTRRNEEIIALRKSGNTFKHISEETGLTECAIKYICNKNGINEEYNLKSGVGKGETRICRRCGKEFECSPGHNKKYCSRSCQRNSNDVVSGAKKRRESIIVVDKDISLRRLYERDNGICHICGRATDWNDYVVINGKKCSKKNYPSIDHIKPVAHGGVHSWGNVALAHIACNARKCDHE